MRVLIVADNALMAEAIRRALRHTSRCSVIGFVDGREAPGRVVREASPDVVLIDEMDGSDRLLTTIRDVRAQAPEAKLILLAKAMDGPALSDALAAGVDAAVAKSCDAGSLGMLVREVAAGNVFHAFTQPVAAAPATSTLDLTSREQEILKLVAAGTSNGRIARELWVTEQTIKFHLSNIYRKLGVANRTQASHYAHVHGLLDPEDVALVGEARGDVAVAA
ncbi:MAG: hypothetical protein QOD65_443 [Gaiellales bacterium]|jgi:DNA-binding NarL/FixJ family response regulator|nr:hypothetical protein [Gaiellales bacterium]